MKHNRSWTDSLDPSILHNFPQVQVDNFFVTRLLYNTNALLIKVSMSF